MARFFCMAPRDAALHTRPFFNDEDEDDPRRVLDGYADPSGLMADERFEADLMLDGLDALDVVTVTGDDIGPGWFKGSRLVLAPEEVARQPAGPWLARLAAQGSPAQQARATEILEGVNDLPPRAPST